MRYNAGMISFLNGPGLSPAALSLAAAANDEDWLARELAPWLAAGVARQMIRRPAGDSPLHIAARLGFEGCARMLLSICAPDEVDSEGRVALSIAIRAGHWDTARALIPLSDLNATDLYGACPLTYAARAGAVDLCKELVEAGANVQDTSSAGYTALRAAIEKGHFPVCELLVGLGVDPRARLDDYKNDSLLLSAVYGHTSLVAYFMTLCDPMVLTKEGANAFLVSCGRGNWESARLLARAGSPSVSQRISGSLSRYHGLDGVGLAQALHGERGREQALLALAEGLALGEANELGAQLSVRASPAKPPARL